MPSARSRSSSGVVRDARAPKALQRVRERERAKPPAPAVSHHWLDGVAHCHKSGDVCRVLIALGPDGTHPKGDKPTIITVRVLGQEKGEKAFAKALREQGLQRAPQKTYSLGSGRGQATVALHKKPVTIGPSAAYGMDIKDLPTDPVELERLLAQGHPPARSRARRH